MPESQYSYPRGITEIVSVPDKKIKPLVSLVIPIYNGGEFLKKLLYSIANQLSSVADIEQEMEVILSVDSPTDGSDRVAGDFASRYPKIFTLVKHKNVGLVGNRNIGMQLAQGDYIMWADHDDIIPDGALPRAIELLKLYKPDILNFRVNILRADGNFDCQNPEVLEKTMKGTDYMLEAPKSFGTLWDNAIKRSIIQDNNLYSLRYWLSEDMDIRFKAYAHAKSVRGVNEVLYCWRVHRSSESHINTADRKYFEAAIFYLFHHLNYSLKHPEIDRRFWNKRLRAGAKVTLARYYYMKGNIANKNIWHSRIRKFLSAYIKHYGLPTSKDSLVLVGSLLCAPIAVQMGKTVNRLRRWKLYK